VAVGEMLTVTTPPTGKNEMTDDIFAKQSFQARNAALENYKTKSALVNIGPAPPPSVGEQLHEGKRPMAAADNKIILRLP
jgi:hypothetical protein